ncbi:MGDG synthase family glycosyltransferase [Paenibacillus alkalitolerans]|uniref:MGDG synthase family glycosyltransferase n=1 Tax=Paenibacillus alkalitolerans TaxID=2799335 RepID=UPI0018F333EC|nr:glycosyltransferase [Paenibacillus alkalitolerans]
MHKKVLILSEAFGSGHTKAAEALAEGVSLQEPSIQTQIIETGKLLHPVKSELVLRTYKQIIATCPYLWKIIYHRLTKQNQPVPYWLQFMIYRLFHRNIETVLEQMNPDLVICTHPFSSSTLSRVKKNGYPVSLCTVITDFHAHRVWVHPEVDLYIVSNDEVCRQLIQMGIQKHRITVAGIPIKSSFWMQNSKQEARRKLNLKNMPTVLVMGGGLGLGGIRDVARWLMKWKESIQLIICTGFNDSLRISFERDKHFRHPHIVIVGFVDNIDELLDAADLLVTKPGGLTCFEALSKGVPMLIYQPIPGHEEYNCNHLVKHHMAIRINNRQDTDRWIEKLLFFPEALERLSQNMKQFQQKMNPYAGVKAVIDLLANNEATQFGDGPNV